MTLRSPVPRAENSPHVTLKQKSTVGPKYKQLRTLQSTASKNIEFKINTFLFTFKFILIKLSYLGFLL